MSKRALWLLLFLAGLGGFYLGRGGSQIALAQTQQARCPVTVPREWGEFRGSSQTGYAFEDQSGTIRVLTQLPCGGLGGPPLIGIEIRRN